MTRKVAEKVSALLIRSAGVSADKQAILLYGMELIISSVIGVILLIAVSVILKRPLSWCVFLLGFIPIRVTAGGHHARSHFWCYITITVLFALCLFLVVTVTLHPCWSMIISSSALLLVALFSPVETQSKPLSGKQRAANRILSLIFSILNLVFAITNYICHISTGMIQLYFLGVAAATVLFIAAIISRQRRRAFK